MISNLYKHMERFVHNVDIKFHDVRKPITTPICRFLTFIHVNQSHVTAVRFSILIAFLPLWIYEQYHVAVLMLAINILLDIVDGDLARFLIKDSDLRKFEDVIVDNIMVVILPLALIWQGIISGFLGAYYIFIVTLSWWLSVIKRNEESGSNWFFRAQASSFLFFTRFCIITTLIFLYALFGFEVFSQALIALSIILTINAMNDYRCIIKSKSRW